MISSLLASTYRTKSRLRRISRLRHVPPSALTLDIGSGDSPFAVADVICDKFPWDDRERTAHLTHDRPMVAGDIEALPFKTGTFDFVHCSHVLEHTIHPDRAIQEIMRVGKAGYIEVPSAYHEKTVSSIAGHLWFVTLEDGKLIFTPKPRGILDESINRNGFGGLVDKDPLFRAFYFARFYGLYSIEYFWEGAIRYEVRGEAKLDADFDKGSVDWSHGEMKSTREGGVVQIFKDWMYKRASRGKRFELKDILACPRCRSGLTREENHWSCVSCHARFQIRDNIPVLLIN